MKLCLKFLGVLARNTESWEFDEESTLEFLKSLVSASVNFPRYVFSFPKLLLLRYGEIFFSFRF